MNVWAVILLKKTLLFITIKSEFLRRLSPSEYIGIPPKWFVEWLWWFASQALAVNNFADFKRHFPSEKKRNKFFQCYECLSRHFTKENISCLSQLNSVWDDYRLPKMVRWMSLMKSVVSQIYNAGCIFSTYPRHAAAPTKSWHRPKCTILYSLLCISTFHKPVNQAGEVTPNTQCTFSLRSIEPIKMHTVMTRNPS